MKKTKIIATIGPASSDYETLKQIIEAGANVVRLNMSHGSHEEQMERVLKVRNINEELNSAVGILLDTKGPEVRTGEFKEGTVFEAGSIVRLVNDDIVGDNTAFSVSYKGLANDLKVGDIILLDDGYVSVQVKEIDNQDLICEVLNTGQMKDRRGVNVPGVTLNFEFISPKDEDDIIWACENNFDYIAASFVRNKQDALALRDVIAKTGNTNIKLLAKIESQDGVENFDEILEVCDGIMIARGDLGVEIPAEDVPAIQLMIIDKCNKHGKIVITATQMLESMQHNPRPTRAEVSDVFNAVLSGTDAVMLSGESAAGDYPVEAVRMQAKICEKAEESFSYDKYNQKIFKNLDNTIQELVAYSVTSTAAKLPGAKLIIAITNSGATAKSISRMKPALPILAITHNEDVRRGLSLNYGVLGVNTKKQDSLDASLDEAVKIAKQMGIVDSGDTVIISAGSIEGKGNTDLMKVRVVN